MSSETKLPTAQQIARERVKDLPTETYEQRMTKAVRFQIETAKAKAELESGEWRQ